ncbi:MAG: hypothetical protein PHU25_09125 [Deltaproteobacteria bacterium]|nr:hypothetical protein [Deltaproteobacteria bacterium]
MWEFMMAGGYATWLVLALGLGTLGVAVSFAWRPAERKLAILRPLSVSTVFGGVSGTCAGFGATLMHVNANPEWAHGPDMHLIVMTGIGESLTSTILGFTILCLAWLVVAVGMRRQA